MVRERETKIEKQEREKKMRNGNEEVPSLLKLRQLSQLLCYNYPYHCLH